MFVSGNVVFISRRYILQDRRRDCLHGNIVRHYELNLNLTNLRHLFCPSLQRVGGKERGREEKIKMGTETGRTLVGSGVYVREDPVESSYTPVDSRTEQESSYLGSCFRSVRDLRPNSMDPFLKVLESMDLTQITRFLTYP